MPRIKHAVQEEAPIRYDREGHAEGGTCLISIELPTLLVRTSSDVGHTADDDQADIRNLPINDSFSSIDAEQQCRNDVLSSTHHMEDHSKLSRSLSRQRVYSTIWDQLKTMFRSYINVILVFSPIGIALHYSRINDTVVLVVNLIAIVPLSSIVVLVVEDIALYMGDTFGGVFNAIFGNAVELIISTTALFQGQFTLIQSMLLGSMLSRLLLALGLSFFLGGFNTVEQAFDANFAQNASSLLFLAVISLTVPTAFESWAQTGSDLTTSDQPLVSGVLQVSRATAVLLLTIHVAHLMFQLKIHKVKESRSRNEMSDVDSEERRDPRIFSVRTRYLALANWTSSHMSNKRKQSGENVANENRSPISLMLSLVILAVLAALVALNARFLIESWDSVVCYESNFSVTFFRLILLPLVYNAVEDVNVILLTMHDKIDMSISLAIGASLQTVLLVLPSLVVIGWFVGKEGMTLYFDGFQLIILFLAVLLLNYLVRDGGVNWLEGYILIVLYVVVAVATWFYPTSAAAYSCSTS